MAVPVASRSRRALVLEVLSVMLIALTAVLTAWSAFESSKWSGVMSIQFNKAGAVRTESVRKSNLANQQTSIDVGLFSNFANAYGQDNMTLADFYKDRFPERLAVATDAWVKLDPLHNANAPSSPFAMPEYKVPAAAAADKLQAEADRHSREALQANQKGDNYTITSVFYATAILLAALAVKMDRERMEIVLLALGTIVLVGTSILIATYPVTI